MIDDVTGLHYPEGPKKGIEVNEVEFPTKDFGDWTDKDFEQALKATQQMHTRFDNLLQRKDICPSRDDAQEHLYDKNGICLACYTKRV